MKTVLITTILASVILCGQLTANTTGFTPPNRDQISAAASDPSTHLDVLLEGASQGDVSQVVKLVLAEILQLDLEADIQSARIAEVIKSAFGVVPAETHVAFAQELGFALARSAVIQLAPDVISTIQTAIVSFGGDQASSIAQSFQTSYQVNQQQSGTGQTAAIEPPPVASFYPGQTL